MHRPDVPERDLVEITERIVRAAPRDPKDTSRYLACRWLNRLYYDVSKWNRDFIKFLRTYPGFDKSSDQGNYRSFFKNLAEYESSLDDRYGQAKGTLCANLKMLAARFTIDFSWLYTTDETKYDELYDLVRNAYASEDSILEIAKGVVRDVVAKDNLRYTNELEKEIDRTAFLVWHVEHHMAVVETIRSYEKHSAEVVKRLDQIAHEADVRLLTIEEYDKGLSDPLKHPDTMVLRELIMSEKTIRESNEPRYLAARQNTLLAYVFGAVFVIAILTLVVFIPNPTPVQYHVFVVVMALAAGGIATVMTGMLDVRMSLGKRLTIGATGALGVFVIVYVFLPAMRQ